MIEEKRQPTTDAHLRALVIEMRKNTAAMAALAQALNGLVNAVLSDQNAPPDAEVEAPKKPAYLHPDDCQ